MFNYGLLQSKLLLPAPQLLVLATSPKDGTLIQEVDAILDSGAAMTCIPMSVIEELGKYNLDFSIKNVKGATGGSIEITTYLVNIMFSNHEYRDIEVIPLERNYALVGRDILNMHEIHMFGPKKKWRIKK